MIPLVDLRAQYQAIKPEIDQAVQRVIESTSFILGSEVQDFEEAFAGFCGAEYGVGTSSGTSALHLALLACGVGPGDEVITTPLTFIATAEAISHTGARPVFVDISPDTYCIDPGRIEATITDRTKAILPVHLYGHPADMDRILDIANANGLPVIEDAAQAHGSEYKGQRVGAIGRVGCFSFYPGKNLGAYGDGGIVVTSDPEIYERVRLLRNHGRSTKHEHVIEGYGYRLDALQAAILNVKLRHLEEWVESRRHIADLYGDFLDGASVRKPEESDFAKHAYHLYVIQLNNRAEAQRQLKAQGIITGIHYPTPLHFQPAYRHLKYKAGSFPIAELACRRIVSLPMFPELSEDRISLITDAVRSFA